MEGIHDFVELQGSDETLHSSNAATQGFRSNFSCPGSTEERRIADNAPQGSRAIENNDSESKVGGSWWPHKVLVQAYHPLHLL